MTSKNSLPEKQLLSRYRHVYAGKGGWFQGRTSFTPQSNYAPGQSGGHLDVYRKELIMKLSKDIFESSKSKIASADFVVSNKVAGERENVHAATTQLGEGVRKDITSVDDDNPLPIKSARVQHQRAAPSFTATASYQPRQGRSTAYGTDATRGGGSVTTARANHSATVASRNRMRISLRAGIDSSNNNTRHDAGIQQQQQAVRLNATSAAGYNRSSTGVKSTPTIDSLTSLRHTAAEVNAKRAEESPHVAAHPSQEQIIRQSNPNRADEKKSHNDPENNYACNTLNGSNSILLEESLETQRIAKRLSESRIEEQIDYVNETQEINNEQESGFHYDKSGTELESKRLSKDSEANREAIEEQELRQDNTASRDQHSSTKTRIVTDENNSQEIATHKHELKLKSGKSRKSRESKEHAKQKLQPEDNLLDSILGEIQFNVLRQRSFIRLPKKVAAKVLETERLATRHENGFEPRQLLSRMSLSQEARDALQETRKEMRLENDVDLDKFDLRKLNSRGNKRPTSPEPCYSSCDDNASDNNNNSDTSLPPTRLQTSTTMMSRAASKRSGKARGGVHANGTAAQSRSNNNNRKLDIPLVLYNGDSYSRERFNQTIEQGHQQKVTAGGSRSSTVATPITDLIPAMPKQQQDGYQRYSTHMSRDTPRANQKTPNNKQRNVTSSSGNALLTPRSHPTTGAGTGNDTKTAASAMAKKGNTSYTLPLKTGAAAAEETTLRRENDSLKSDWESQYRAMSKYGLVTEKSFQITPPGWDERYKDLARKNNYNIKPEPPVDVALAQMKEQAIEKCSDWLQKCN